MLAKPQYVARLAGQLLDRRIVEPFRPVISEVRPIPLPPLEIVHHIAAADDHHAMVPQPAETYREIEMMVQRLQCVDRAPTLATGVEAMAAAAMAWNAAR